MEGANNMSAKSTLKPRLENGFKKT